MILFDIIDLLFYVQCGETYLRLLRTQLSTRQLSINYYITKTCFIFIIRPRKCTYVSTSSNAVFPLLVLYGKILIHIVQIYGGECKILCMWEGRHNRILISVPHIKFLDISVLTAAGIYFRKNLIILFFIY